MPDENLEVVQRLEYAAATLDRVLSFFQRVDTRAQVLMSVDIAMLFLLATNPGALSTAWWATLIYVVPVVLVGLSLLKIYRVFYPQLNGPEGSLIFFREITKLTASEYVDRFGVATVAQHMQDVLTQVWRNSEILSEKFTRMREAMVATMLALPFWAFALAISGMSQSVIYFK